MRYLPFLLLFITLHCTAAIYQWTDQQGVQHFSDRPTGNAQPVKLAPLAHMRPSTVNTNSQPDKPSAIPKKQNKDIERPKHYEITILHPNDKQNLPTGERANFTVKIQLNPKLAKGDHILYMLDDSKPVRTDQTSYAFPNLDRGEHRISVAVQREGKIINQTDLVTFFIQQYSVQNPQRLIPVTPVTPIKTN